MITVLTPTRGRPGAARELDEALHDTAVLDTKLLLLVDEDDPQLPAYLAPAWHPRTRVVVGPRRRLGPTLNYWAGVLAFLDPRLVVAFMGDDHRPRTPGWDRRVEEVMDRRTVAYGDDLLQGQRLPTAVFISGELICRLGYMVPPALVHLYLDDFWLALGQTTRLVYLPEVVIEHLHPAAGKAAWDQGYLECNAPELDARDHRAFDRYLRDEWPTTRERLR